MHEYQITVGFWQNDKIRVAKNGRVVLSQDSAGVRYATQVTNGDISLT